MINRKLRYISLFLLVIIISSNLVACGKKSTSDNKMDTKVENLTDNENKAETDMATTDDFSSEGQSETITELVNGEEVTKSVDGTGKKHFKDKDGTDMVISETASSLASKGEVATIAKAAINNASKLSDNSKVAKENNGVSLNTFSNITDSEMAAAKTIKSSIVNDSMSEYAKVKAIHDYLVDSVTYPDLVDVNNESLFTARGALIAKSAVCQGYADAFSLLCYLSGVQAEVVSGPANNGSGEVGHAWNQVRIDGTWYNIDCTWDDPTTESGDPVRIYDYFLVTDASLNKDHDSNGGYGYLPAKHACNDNRYEANNAYLTDNALCNYNISSNLANTPYKIVNSTGDVTSACKTYKDGNTKNYCIIYKSSAMFTSNEQVKSASSEIAEAIYSAYTGSGVTVSISYYTVSIPSQYIFIELSVN